jgi:hypothetical protein
MQWQLILVIGLAVSAILFLVAVVLYLNMQGVRSAVQRVWRLRIDSTRYRVTTKNDCRG